MNETETRKLFGEANTEFKRGLNVLDSVYREAMVKANVPSEIFRQVLADIEQRKAAILDDPRTNGFSLQAMLDTAGKCETAFRRGVSHCATIVVNAIGNDSRIGRKLRQWEQEVSDWRNQPADHEHAPPTLIV